MKNIIFGKGYEDPYNFHMTVICDETATLKVAF